MLAVDQVDMFGEAVCICVHVQVCANFCPGFKLEKVRILFLNAVFYL